MHGHTAGVDGELIGLAGVVGVVFDGGAELLHGSGGLLQRAGLAFGAAGQVLVALGDLGAGNSHALGALAHAVDHADQAGLHQVNSVQQFGHFVTAFGIKLVGQITLGYGVGGIDCTAQRRGNAACQAPAKKGRKQEPENNRAD
ncbi:hypothetical protein GALL_442110 [mine drainage metagenome]|uniref:Uncharacterized protein n=1 Tax=mine drainage metagenome TaxID=410659 RepID=A0A1J5PRN9_9ZZZZ